MRLTCGEIIHASEVEYGRCLKPSHDSIGTAGDSGILYSKRAGPGMRCTVQFASGTRDEYDVRISARASTHAAIEPSWIPRQVRKAGLSDSQPLCSRRTKSPSPLLDRG